MGGGDLRARFIESSTQFAGGFLELSTAVLESGDGPVALAAAVECGAFAVLELDAHRLHRRFTLLQGPRERAEILAEIVQHLVPFAESLVARSDRLAQLTRALALLVDATAEVIEAQVTRVQRALPRGLPLELQVERIVGRSLEPLARVLVEDEQTIDVRIERRQRGDRLPGLLESVRLLEDLVEPRREVRRILRAKRDPAADADPLGRCAAIGHDDRDPAEPGLVDGERVALETDRREDREVVLARDVARLESTAERDLEPVGQSVQSIDVPVVVRIERPPDVQTISLRPRRPMESLEEKMDALHRGEASPVCERHRPLGARRFVRPARGWIEWPRMLDDLDGARGDRMMTLDDGGEGA